MTTPHRNNKTHYIAVKEPFNNRRGYKTKYVYYGPWYMWDVSPHELKQKKCILCFACVINVVIFIFCATRYAQVNSVLLVETPATLSVIALMFEAVGIAQFCLAKPQMTQSGYQDINNKLRIAPLAHSILLLLTVIFGVYYLIRTSFSWISLLVLLGFAVCAGLSVMIYGKYRLLPFRSEKNPDAKGMFANQEASVQDNQHI